MIRELRQDEKASAFWFLKEKLAHDAFLSSGSERMIEKLEDMQDACTWLMEEDRGTVRAVLSCDENHRIVFLYVAEEYRKQGIGTALIKDMIADVREMNIVRIRATVTDLLVRFLEKNGFEILSEDSGVYTMEYLCGKELLGTTVNVIVEQKYGTLDQRSDGEMTVNCGFVSQPASIVDREMIDAYVVGVYQPCDSFTGTVIGLVCHEEDDRMHLLVAPVTLNVKKEEIIEQIGCVEQYYRSRLVLVNEGE